MYKLGFEEAQEPEIKLPTITGSQRMQGSLKKMHLIIDYAKAFDCVNHNK